MRVSIRSMTTKVRALIYILPILSALFLLLILNTTNPLDGGPAAILVVFILLYIVFAGLFFVLLRSGVRIASRIWAQRKTINAREWRIGVRRAYYVASVLAFGPVLLLAMQSVGQLQLRDVLLVVALLSLAIFYVIKRS